jgi:hypothetical protein
MKFEEWKIKNNVPDCEVDEDIFNSFFQDMNEREENTVIEILSYLAYQLYELQICIEGVILEQEDLWTRKLES